MAGVAGKGLIRRAVEIWSTRYVRDSEWEDRGVADSIASPAVQAREAVVEVLVAALVDAGISEAYCTDQSGLGALAEIFSRSDVADRMEAALRELETALARNQELVDAHRGFVPALDGLKDSDSEPVQGLLTIICDLLAVQELARPGK